jgi:putative redox protein
MQHTVKTEWKGEMLFDADVYGHHLLMDTLPESGGSNQAPRPITLMLAALAGCTGMDVVSILKKMRVELKNFNIEVVADRKDEYPKQYNKMHIIYLFTGKNLPMDKVKKAIELSKERYCGVWAVYREAMEVTYEIKIIEEDRK